MRNRIEVPEEIRTTVPRSPLSERAEARLQETYALLEERQPVRNRKKAWVAPLSAACAALALFVGVGFAFPTFAETLPIIGAIFRQFSESNKLPQNERDMAAYLQEHAASPEADQGALPTVAVLPAGESEKPLAVSVQESYYDGNYVFIGLELDAEIDEPILYENTLDVSINGETQFTYTGDGEKHEKGFALFYEYDTSAYWRKGSRGKYIARRAFRVPEKFRNEERLSIAMTRGPVSYTIEDGTPENPSLRDIFLNTASHTLTFTVEKQTTKQKLIDCTEMESNGIRLESVIASPVCTEITVAYPASDPPSLFAQFADGRSIGYLTNMQNRESDGITERHTLFAAGLRENEERKLVVCAYDKSAEIFDPVVFLIDLQGCTATIGTADDLVEYHNVPNWYCDWERLENFTGTHQITYLNLSRDSMKIAIATTDTEARSLKCEVEQAGALIFSESAFRCNFDTYCLYYGDMETGDTRTAEGLCSYWTSLYGLESLDTSLPAVIHIFDCDTGELLTEETVVFDEIQ